MRSRIVTPEEMRHLFGAEVSHFTYAFALTRREKRFLEAGKPWPQQYEVQRLSRPQKSQAILALALRSPDHSTAPVSAANSK